MAKFEITFEVETFETLDAARDIVTALSITPEVDHIRVMHADPVEYVHTPEENQFVRDNSGT